MDRASSALSIPWDATWVTAVAFCGTPRQLVAGNQNGQLLLFDLPDKSGEPAKVARRLDGHKNGVTGLAVTPDGRWLISASLDRSIRLWDLRAAAKGTEAFILNAKSHAKAVKEAADRGKPMPATLAVSVEVQPADHVLTGHSDWVRSMCLSLDGARLLTGDDRGLIILWDLAGRQEIRRLQLSGWVTGLAMTADGRRAATCEFVKRYGNDYHSVRIWDLETGECVRDITKECPGTLVCGWSPDGQLLALGQGGEIDRGKIRLVEAASGKKVGELPGHSGGVTEVRFHPKGEQLASCGRDTLARMWAIQDGKQLQQLGLSRGSQSKDWIHAIAFAPEQSRLAGADMGGWIHVWELT